MASVPCEECIKYMHDENWQPVMRMGKKLERAKGDRPPCGQCPKVPAEVKLQYRENLTKITPYHTIEWTPQSRQAWGLYWQTKSGSQPQHDEYSREVCGHLEQIVTLSTRRLQDPSRLAGMVLGILGKG